MLFQLTPNERRTLSVVLLLLALGLVGLVCL